MVDIAVREQTIFDWLRTIRRTSTPLTAIVSSDLEATQRGIVQHVAEQSEPYPIVAWDCMRGLYPANNAAVAAGIEADADMTQPDAMLHAARELPPRSMLIMHNVGLYLLQVTPEITQAIHNLRDAFKHNRRTLVLLDHHINIPTGLEHDVVVYHEPLPTKEQYAEIVAMLYDAVKIAQPVDATMSEICNALQGLSAYAAEQQVAMCMEHEGVNLSKLWHAKKEVIDQSKGLTFFNDMPGFQAVLGCDAAVSFLDAFHRAKEPIGCIVWLDEMEKALAGHSSDTSGVTQDYLGALLTEIEDTKAMGVAFLGHPGTGKSWLAQNAGNNAIPVIRLDIGACKGSLVGESEANLRHALRVIRGLSAGKVLWIATMNAIANLPTALKRRFNFTFFFDLPGEQERLALWSHYRKENAIDDKEIPQDEGWTGAEISKACMIAGQLGLSLKEASKYIVPIAIQDRAGIERLRKEADGRYLSASQAGVYRLAEQPATRGIEL